MAFWSVQEQLRLEAWHIMDLKRLGDTFTIYYCATSAVVRRPEHGRAGEQISCGHCGENVEFTVLCSGLTRRRRAWSLGLGIPLLCAAGLLGFVSYQAVGQAASPLWPLVSVIAVVLLFGSGIAGVTYSLVFFGVRSPRLWAGQPAPPGSHLGTFQSHLDRKPRRRGHRLVSVHQHPVDPADAERPPTTT